jgi:RNA polymerase sigma-70 factor (ECF subfamily)
MAIELDITGLIAASRKGDFAAREKLLGYYREYLRLLAHLHVKPLLKSKFDESDVVQETCMQAIEGFEQFRGANEKQFAAWLRQILANKGAWMARKYLADKRDIRLEQSLKQQIDQSSIDLGKFVPDKYSSPSHVAMGRERVVILAEAIEQLRDDQKDVLIMRGLQGMSIPDVAKALGRSEASTWKLWARGLQALRTKDRL